VIVGSGEYRDANLIKLLINGEVDDRAAPTQGDKCAHFGSRMDAVPFKERIECFELGFGAKTSGVATETGRCFLLSWLLLCTERF